MADEPDELEPDELEGDDEEAEDEETDGEGPKPASVSRNYAPLPDGVLTLVGFSKKLREKPPKGRFVDVKSQVLYSTAKNTKSFPAYQHTDGRWVINVEEGLKWWDEKEQRKADRVASAQPLEEDEGEEVEAS